MVVNNCSRQCSTMRICIAITTPRNSGFSICQPSRHHTSVSDIGHQPCIYRPVVICIVEVKSVGLEARDDHGGEEQWQLAQARRPQGDPSGLVGQTFVPAKTAFGLRPPTAINQQKDLTSVCFNKIVKKS